MIAPRSGARERIAAAGRGAFPVHHLHSPGLKSDEQAGAERVRASAEVDGAQVDSFFVRPQVVHDDAVPARTPRFGDRGPGLFGGLERPVFILKSAVETRF